MARLPADILKSERASLIALSSTCTFYRAVVAPLVFTSLVLENTKRSADSLLSIIAQGKYAGVVQKLAFKGYIVGNNNNKDDGCVISEALSEELFPSEVDRLLSNLSPMRVYAGDVKKAIKQEKKILWLHLATKALAAICRGGDKNCWFKNLQLLGMTPRIISPFLEENFHRMLRSLTAFTLKLSDREDGTFRERNYAADHFAYRMSKYFFDHLENLTNFKLSASADPICYVQYYYGLRPQHMPHLRNIKLTYILLCSNLARFLGAHSQTLETISLLNCFCRVAPSIFDLAWDTLFKTVRNSNPQNLRKLEVVNPSNRQLEQLLSKVCSKHGLPHSMHFNYKYPGHVDRDIDDHPRIEESFVVRDDHHEYEALMDFIEANRARADARK
ncbi:MAG: hypothetical protein M1834_005185 [Cirrosporium novae-zelandiae]|nr:MAG: hypothetical protein M1834_005185 [Cirrosporium novae-zelandiae]